MQQFVHLGIHTEFSITESIVRIPDLIKTAVKQDMPALALTDLSNLHAAVKFYKSCLGKGIKPILGSTIRLNDAEHKATLLAIDNHGWRSITELVSQGYIEGQQLDIPCVKKEWILNQHEGIIVLLGLHSDVGQLLCSSNPQKAEPLFQEWHEKFGNRVYFALSRTNRPNEEDFISEAIKLAAKYQVGVVAHNDVHFITEEDFEAHEARVCIADGYVLADDRRPRFYSTEQYFKTAEQMIDLFADIPSAIENTVQIAKRCNVSLRLGKYFLPDYPIPEGFTIDQMADKISDNVLTKSDKDKTPFTKEEFLKVVTDSTFIEQMKTTYPELFESLPASDSGVKYQLEGYLFPATYEYTKKSTMTSVVEHMIATMNQNLQPYYEKIKTGPNPKTVNEILSIAALTEKEANNDADRRNVAQVFYNRMNVGMTLGSNISILYAEGKLGQKTTLAEDAAVNTSLDSPFNLYLHSGYGPGPVTNPSLSAIKAAVEPTDNNDLYFVADVTTGKVYFSETQAEHDANVQKYVNDKLENKASDTETAQ